MGGGVGAERGNCSDSGLPAPHLGSWDGNKLPRPFGDPDLLP